MDLVYEPALSTFLEWQPVVNFFGHYIKQLQQVRPQGIASHQGTTPHGIGPKRSAPPFGSRHRSPWFAGKVDTSGSSGRCAPRLLFFPIQSTHLYAICLHSTHLHLSWQAARPLLAFPLTDLESEEEEEAGEAPPPAAADSVPPAGAVDEASSAAAAVAADATGSAAPLGALGGFLLPLRRT